MLPKGVKGMRCTFKRYRLYGQGGQQLAKSAQRRSIRILVGAWEAERLRDMRKGGGSKNEKEGATLP